MAKKVVHLMMSHIVFNPWGPGRFSMLGSMFGDNKKKLQGMLEISWNGYDQYDITDIGLIYYWDLLGISNNMMTIDLEIITIDDMAMGAPFLTFFYHWLEQKGPGTSIMKMGPGITRIMLLGLQLIIEKIWPR
jgi:hypothetical protein